MILLLGIIYFTGGGRHESWHEFCNKKGLAFAHSFGGLGLTKQDCLAQYSYIIVPVGENLEYQFYYDQFHFGTIVKKPDDALAFRPHPDQFDINGWGSTAYLNAFLASGTPSQGAVNSISASSQGIQVSVDGQIDRQEATNYGNYSYNLSFSYDPTFEKLFGSGNLSVQLPGTLTSAGEDLNLTRLASNVLTGVPLQVPLVTNPPGTTGDMSRAFVKYAPGGDPRDFQWYPPDSAQHHSPRFFLLPIHPRRRHCKHSQHNGARQRISNRHCPKAYHAIEFPGSSRTSGKYSQFFGTFFNTNLTSRLHRR